MGFSNALFSPNPNCLLKKWLFVHFLGIICTLFNPICSLFPQSLMFYLSIHFVSSSRESVYLISHAHPFLKNFQFWKSSHFDPTAPPKNQNCIIQKIPSASLIFREQNGIFRFSIFTQAQLLFFQNAGCAVYIYIFDHSISAVNHWIFILSTL